MTATSLPKFRAAPGSQIKKSHALALGATMADLHSRGELTPAAMVDEARDPTSPTHECYEWDDGLAAERFRLDQARHHMRSILVTIKGSDGEQQIVRYAYVIEGSDDPYITVRELSKDKVSAQRVADQIYQDAFDLLTTYQRYSEIFATELRPFRGVAASISKLPKKKRRAA